MLLNVGANIINDFIQNSPSTFTIRSPSGFIPSTIIASSFGIALAMTRAYRDTQRVCKYIQGATYTSGHFTSQPVLRTIFTEVYTFVTNLNSYSTQAAFDRAHDNLCLSLCGNYSSSRGRHVITYGIAQKIVNMTLKYLFVEHRINPHLGLLSNNTVEDFFHCPIDSYVLRKLKLVDPSYFSMIRQNSSTATFNNRTWSNLTQGDYLHFLTILRNKLLPHAKQLEADFCLWSPSIYSLSCETVVNFNLHSCSPNALIGVIFI